MHDFFQKATSNRVPCDGVIVVIFFETIYDKTIIVFGFWDIGNDQGLVSVNGISRG